MSYIIVSADKVASAAMSVIDEINAERKRRNEQHIANEMQKRKYIFFGPTLTKEEADKSLRNGSASCWYYPSTYAFADKEQAHKLLTLAQNGDPVMVTTEDAWLLWRK